MPMAATVNPVPLSHVDPEVELSPSYDHLSALEAEAVHIMREVVAEFERPVLLFSGGKDSIVMLRIAEKAFFPSKIPFPLMHVDTGHNFPEVIAFRDLRVAELQVKSGNRRRWHQIGHAARVGCGRCPSASDDIWCQHHATADACGSK